jgi:hypothetical protein
MIRLAQTQEIDPEQPSSQRSRNEAVAYIERFHGWYDSIEEAEKDVIADMERQKHLYKNGGPKGRAERSGR